MIEQKDNLALEREIAKQLHAIDIRSHINIPLPLFG